MTDELERELIAQFQGGDPSAFGVLLEAHQNRVIHMGLQILRNEESALDVAQEVFLRAYEELPPLAWRSPVQHMALQNRA